VCIHLVRTIYVVDVLSATGNEPLVFFASDRGTYAIFSHALPLIRLVQPYFMDSAPAFTARTMF